jgi:hypothetical protein
VLAKGRAYDLVKAYEKEPHVEFANCKKDEDFRRFVLRWGPLRVSDDVLMTGLGREPIRYYQADSRMLRAMLGIMGACRGRKDLRAPLVEFFKAQINHFPLLDSSIRKTFSELVALEEISAVCRHELVRDPIKWATEASIAEIQKVLASCIERWCHAPSRWGLRVQETKTGLEIKPSFELHSLIDALRWMIFYDEWNHRPPTLCSECPRIFRPDTAHERKFCSPECAHRAANRAWRRKDLKERAIRRRKGGTNVTRKTR